MDKVAHGGFTYSDNADITSSIDAYPPNNIGIYNISGNAQEMVQEKGILCGGEWKSPRYDVRIESIDTYEKPADDIGFRYFIEIIEE